MKKTFLTLVSVFIVCYSFAQTNTFPPTGKVGITTLSPNALLSFGAGAGQADPVAGTSTGTLIAINDNTVNAFGLGMGALRNSKYDIWMQTGASNGGGYRWYIGTSEKMTMDYTGRIGIGTTAPTYLLSVGGNATSVSGGASSIQYLPTITSGIYAGHVSQLIAAPTANSSALYYGVLGEAGVNTGVTYNFTSSTGVIGVAGSIAHRGTGNITSVMSLLAGGETISNGGTITNAYGLYVSTIGVSGVTNSYGVYQSSATDPNYFAGNVSIGTTSTQGYKFAVNGTAIATAMTVKLFANWPDYVFKPQYNLPPLSEVKTYIDQNQHLPDMPSEAEVTKNGINLGEINTLLTKKVEELTLYLIKQQEEIDQLKVEIKQMSKTTKSSPAEN